MREAWYTVTDIGQARLLTEPQSRFFFEPFLAQDRTISAAAREIECAVDALFYRVQKFVDAGLLVVTRVEPRAGKPIKHYRSNADAYYIPFDLTPFATLEEHLAGQMLDDNRTIVQSMANLLRKMGLEGRRLYRNSEGEVWSDAASDSHTPFQIGAENIAVAYDFSIRLSLDWEEAVELQQELHALYERYIQRASESGKQYIWRVALVPTN